MGKALLIIDVQNDFLPPNGSLAVNRGGEIIKPIIKLMDDEDWDSIVMTRDWHNADHTSFAVNHGLPEFAEFTYDSPVPNSNEKQDAMLWPVHCVQGTMGSHVADELQEILLKHPEIAVVNKGYLKDREYYSAFNDIWNDHKTELHDLLQNDKIEEVVVVGLALDYCVKSTAMSAAKLGYKTTILKDYCRAIDNKPEAMQKLYEELKRNNVKLV